MSLVKSRDHGDARVVLLGNGSDTVSDSETTPLLRSRDSTDSKQRWKSIRVMYLTMFVGSIGFSIVLSSVWPFLEEVDACVTTAFLGYVVAAYSVGQLIASPLFGWWANKRGSSLTPIVVSLVINFLGCMMYGFSGVLPGQDMSNGAFMLVSRFIIGFGAGSVSVVRAYVSAATTMEERTPAMANISAAQSFGFIVGPGLAAAFRPLGKKGVVWNALRLNFNMFTAPSFLGAFLALVNIALLVAWFKECKVEFDSSIQERNIRTVQDVSEEVEKSDEEGNVGCCGGRLSSMQSTAAGTSVPRIDFAAALICIWLFFVVLFIFSVFETILSPLSMDEFGWDGEQATLYNGIVLLASGVVAIGTFMLIKVLAKRFDERAIFVGGMLICSCAFILYAPFSKDLPPINYYNGTVSRAASLLDDTLGDEADTTGQAGMVQDFVDIRSASWSGIPSHCLLAYHGARSAGEGEDDQGGGDLESTSSGCSGGTRQNFTDLGGCPLKKYHWCNDQGSLNFYQFLAGSLLMAIGYPTCGVMCYAIFSKILGPFPQGTWMGALTAAGSAARAFGPMVVSNLYSSFGPRVAFLCTSAFVFLTTGVLLLVYRRLVPYGSRLKQAKKR